VDGKIKRKIIGSFVFALLIFSDFLVFPNPGNADSGHVIINQIRTGSGYFIELYNPTDSVVALESWSLQYRGGTASSFSRKNFVSGNSIPAHGYFLIGYDKQYGGEAALDMSWSQTLSSAGATVFLVSDQTYLTEDTVSGPSVVDRVAYGTGTHLFPEISPAPKPSAAESIERVDFQDSDDNSSDFLVNDSPLPRNSNSVEEEAEDDPEEEEKPEDEEPEISGSGDYDIRINELLPYPKGDKNKDSYIEIYNGEDFGIDLKGWMIKNNAKTTKFVFPEGYILKPGGYLSVYRILFKFALKTSDTIYLMDPDGNTISSVNYASAKKDISLSFNGDGWKWSSSKTPGKKNKFDPAPKIKIGKIKDAYIGLPILFSTEVSGKNKDEFKYVWDFGDGKRSYLEEVNHTYLKKGKYNVTFSVDNGVGKTVKKMKVEVEKYPTFKLEITGISPNPLEDDADGEWVEIRNGSKKKVNLNGWKLATGQSVLLNHAILSDFWIDAGKTKKMTREYALFSLGNKAGKLELRYPDGKAAARFSYAKDKIEKGETYQKINGQWAWIGTGNSTEVAVVQEAGSTENETISAQGELASDQENAQAPELEKKEEDIGYANIENDDSETLEIAGMVSPLDSDRHKKRIALLNYGTSIRPADCIMENVGRILGTEAQRRAITMDGNEYSFIGFSGKKHWAAQLLENSLASMNSFAARAIVGYI